MNDENGLTVKTGFLRRNGLKILIALLSVLTIGYLLISFSAPARKIKQINNVFNDTISPDLLDKTYPEPDHPELFSLYREKIFLESRLAMAKTGSIGLVVNLQDSTLNIEIGGISLHSSEISYFRVSRIFRAIDPKAFIGLFSKPLTTTRNIDSFDKEPIVVKKAPRDTIEAALQATVPDSVRTGPAFVAMTLDYNIRLSLYQENNGSCWALFNRFFYKSGRRFRQTGEAIWSMVRCKVPDFRPEIRVYIPKENLVTIYRALPEDAQVVIKL